MPILPNNSSRRYHPFFDENLKLVSYCPLCDSHYNLLEARILEEQEGASLIYIRCRKCQSSILALIFNNHMGVSSVGLVTDLNPEEVLRYRSAGEVAEDDVLWSYQYLQKIDTVVELLG
ncbi:hypothetical protein HY933_04000 [Candidatus Falkowbacteria bacterium]|nr:hypothetical protein [Candidatus Falkowbacteria bacterium]